MNFKKWVKSIQTAGYNGARTVLKINGKIWNLLSDPVDNDETVISQKCKNLVKSLIKI